MPRPAHVGERVAYILPLQPSLDLTEATLCLCLFFLFSPYWDVTRAFFERTEIVFNHEAEDLVCQPADTPSGIRKTNQVVPCLLSFYMNFKYTVNNKQTNKKFTGIYRPVFTLH